MKNRNKDSQILDILNKMSKHNNQIVVNTAKYITKKNTPIHVMGEDITYDRPFYETEGRLRYITTLESIETFGAATDGKRIYLSKQRFYQDFNLNTGKEKHRASSDDEIETTPELALMIDLVHEVNHIINRSYITGSLEPTAGEYAEYLHRQTESERTRLRAIDEYHAYTAAQGNLCKMSDKDIRKTIEECYIPNKQVSDSVYQIIWNVDNSF